MWCSRSSWRWRSTQEPVFQSETEADYQNSRGTQETDSQSESAARTCMNKTKTVDEKNSKTDDIEISGIIIKGTLLNSQYDYK